MSLDNLEGIESSVSKRAKQRRTFLKRASATTIVASLPLSSSWARNGTGCSVSGNLSGNLSRECDMDIKGKKRSYWERNMPHTYKNVKWKDIISGVPFSSNNERKDKLSSILDRDNLDAALVVAYLNADQGYYGILLVSPEEYVQGLYNQVKDGYVSEYDMLAAIESASSSGH